MTRLLDVLSCWAAYLGVGVVVASTGFTAGLALAWLVDGLNG